MPPSLKSLSLLISKEMGGIRNRALGQGEQRLLLASLYLGVSFEGGGEVLFFFKHAPRMNLHVLVLCLLCLLTEEAAAQTVIKIAFHVF